MKTALVKISALKEVLVLKGLYTSQSNEELLNSIREEGMKTPVLINEKYELIDGYRRKDVMVLLGHDYIKAIIVDVEATVFERITRNMYRTKTTDDLVKELKSVFEKYPNQKGKRSVDGEKYNRSEKIASA